MATLNRVLPFSAEVFLRLIEHYNAAIWPAQVVAYALGLFLLALVLTPRGGNGRIVAAGLAGFWLWTGAAFHILFLSRLYFMAWAFGALFACQGLLLLWHGAAGGASRFRFRATARGWCGLALAGFALAGYPLAGWLAGHGWPGAQTFGVAPTPTLLFTFGMLLLAEPRAPLRLMAFPALWAVVGGLIAIPLKSFEDLSLWPAAVLALALAFGRRGGRA